MTFEAKCLLIKGDLRMLVTLKINAFDEEEAYRKASSVLHEFLSNGWNLVNFHTQEGEIENE